MATKQEKQAAIVWLDPEVMRNPARELAGWIAEATEDQVASAAADGEIQFHVRESAGVSRETLTDPVAAHVAVHLIAEELLGDQGGDVGGRKLKAILRGGRAQQEQRVAVTKGGRPVWSTPATLALMTEAFGEMYSPQLSATADLLDSQAPGWRRPVNAMWRQAPFPPLGSEIVQPEVMREVFIAMLLGDERVAIHKQTAKWLLTNIIAEPTQIGIGVANRRIADAVSDSNLEIKDAVEIDGIPQTVGELLGELAKDDPGAKYLLGKMLKRKLSPNENKVRRVAPSL